MSNKKTNKDRSSKNPFKAVEDFIKADSSLELPKPDCLCSIFAISDDVSLLTVEEGGEETTYHIFLVPSSEIILALEENTNKINRLLDLCNTPSYRYAA